MNNTQVAHLWANQAKPSAKGSNFYFDGPALYSFGSHFCVGRIVKNKRGEKAFLLNSASYSISTSRHQTYARRAIASGERIFYCSGAYADHKANRAGFKYSLSKALKRIPTRRTADNIGYDYADACAIVRKYNDYSAFFGVRGRLKTPRLSAEDTARRDRYMANAEKRRVRKQAEWAAGEPERARLQAIQDHAAALVGVEWPQ